MTKKKKIINVVISNLITLFFMLIFIMMVFFVFCSITDKKPSIFGFQILRISTGSMEPTYPVDSYIIVKSVDEKSLKKDDVISFYSRNPDIYGQINTHRIVEIHNANGALSFVTKGDANAVADDEQVMEGDVVGKVIYKASLLNWIGKMLHKQWVYFVVVIIPLTILLIKEMKNVAIVSRSLKDDKTDKDKDENGNKEITLEDLVEKYGEDVVDLIKEKRKDDNGK